MAVTTDYTPAIFNYYLSGISDAIENGTEGMVDDLWTETAVIDGVTWTKTHEGSVQSDAGTATDTHVITSSDGFSATGVELVNNYTRATLDSEEDWVAFDDNIDSETWTGDFGNFTVTFSDLGIYDKDIFTGTMTTVSGDLLENVNIIVTFEGDSDFPSALDGTATLNGEVVTFDSSMLLGAALPVNTPAVITAEDSTISENAATVTGTATHTDVDTNNDDNVFQAATDVASTYGTYSVATDGNWTYSLNNAHADVDALNTGETLTDTVKVTAEDNTSKTLDITITGVTDNIIDNVKLVQIKNTAATTQESASIAEIGTDITTGNLERLIKFDVYVNATDLALVATPTGVAASEIYGVDFNLDWNNSELEVLSTNGTILFPVNQLGDSSYISSSLSADSSQSLSWNGANGEIAMGSAYAIVDNVPANDGVIDLVGMEYKIGTFYANPADGADRVEQITLSVKDIVIATDQGEITLNAYDVLISTNTNPDAGNDVAVTNEDTAVIIDVLGNDTDADGDALIVATATANHGTVVINARGALTYLGDQDFNGNDTITYTVDDAQGGTDTATVDVTVIPVNDAAIITPNPASAILDETDVALTTSGTLTATDVDNIDNTFTASATTGTIGDFAIDVDGNWTFNANSAFDELNVGDNKSESFDVTSIDGTPSTVEITINGSNDAATVSSAIVALDETDVALTTSGTLTATDVDNIDNTFTASATTGTIGDFAIDINGNWTFNANSAFDELNVGDNKSETFDVTSIDGTPSTVEITINGSNDAATVSSAVVALDETDVALTTSGTLTATDVDNIDNTFTASATTGTIGDFAIDVDGNWTFNANSAFDELNVGDNKSETFDVTSIDGTPSTVEITINGSNDAATVSSAIVALDETDVALTTSGTLTATDVDNIDNTFTASATTGTIGDFAIDINGNWTFNANSAFDELNVGDNKSETFDVTSIDGTPSTVEITINGSNDAATVSSAVVALDETDVALTTSGTLTATDVDNIDNTFTASATTGTIGDFAIDVDGNWTFNANSAFDELNVGDNKSETFDVTSIDGTPSTVEITINGSNDAATVSSAIVALDETDVALTTSGTLTATDVDNIDNTFTASATTGTIGDFAIDINGNWTFNANSAFDELNVGDNKSETFDVTSIDGTPSTVEITINGTRDIDVMIKTVNGDYLDNATIKYILEDADTNISNLVEEGGIDVVENVMFDKVKIAEDDAYTSGVTISDAVNIYDHLVGLNIIETNSLQFHAADVDNNGKITISDAVAIERHLVNRDPIDTFDLIDEQGNRVTQLDINALDSNADDYMMPTWTIVENGDVNLSGLFNTPAVISAVNGIIAEDEPSITGTATHTDIDANNADNVFTVATNVASTYGTYSVNTDGTWTYNLDNTNTTIDALAVGQSTTDTITVTAEDGTTKDITITIAGTNDAPTVTTSILDGSVNVGSAYALSSSAHFDDVDNGDVLTYSAKVTGGSASGYVNSDELIISASPDDDGAQTTVLEGNYVKIGLNSVGTLGTFGNNNPGIQFDATGTGTFNAADDYLTPGSPWELFTVEATNSSGAEFSAGANNNSYNEIDGVQYGELTNTSSADQNSAQWIDSYSEFDISHIVSFNNDSKFVNVRTEITAKEDLTDLYFLRAIDPDATADAGAGTHDSINYRGNGEVSENQLVYAVDGAGGEYTLGLYTNQTINVNTGISENWSNDASDTYNEVGMKNINGNKSDDAIGLVFKEDVLNAGESVTFEYFYVFGTTIDDALKSSVGEELPLWLSIDADSGELSGTPTASDIATLDISITAIDPHNEYVSDQFTLDIV